MRIYTKIKDTNFINSTLIKLIKIRLTEVMKKYIKMGKSKKMNTYLSGKYNIYIVDIIDAFCKNISIQKYKNYIYDICVDTNAIINGLNLSTLVNTIDYGNFEVKGIHLFDTVLNYIQVNLNFIYRHYLKGGFNSVH